MLPCVVQQRSNELKIWANRYVQARIMQKRERIPGPIEEYMDNLVCKETGFFSPQGYFSYSSAASSLSMTTVDWLPSATVNYILEAND